MNPGPGVHFTILHTESSCGWGGQELRVLTEARGMLRRGHDVHLVCPLQAPLYEAARRDQIPVTALPIGDKRLRGLHAFTTWLSRNRGFQIINTHSSTDAWLVAMAQKLVRWTGTVVRTRHVSTPVSRNLTTRWLYQRATAHVVTTGEALRQTLHRENGLALAHMTSVPTGVDLDRFLWDEPGQARAGLGLAQDRRFLGIVATLRNWKGHTYLLDSFRQLADAWKDWDLLIIGDGPQRQNLTRRISELGLDARVFMAGNQDNVPRWLQALDLFVLPSYGCEGVPQSIVQAMACGLPVVSTTVGAIDEAVVHEQTGLLVTPRATDELTAALARMMNDPVLRARFGEAGAQRARERFGIEAMLVAMEQVYARVVHQ